MRQLAHPRSQLVCRDQAVLQRHLSQPRPFLVLRQMLDAGFRNSIRRCVLTASRLKDSSSAMCWLVAGVA